MEVSIVRQRLREAIERARRSAAARRARADEAARDYERFLDQVATPLFKQVANVLRTEGYPFTVFTPSGSVRLMSDKSAEDFIELTLDSAGDEPRVIGHTSRARGRRVIEAERPIANRAVGELTDEDVLGFLSVELEPFVER
jgi:hypothetical protein